MSVWPVEIIRDRIKFGFAQMIVEPRLALPRRHTAAQGWLYRHSWRAFSIASVEPLSEKW